MLHVDLSTSWLAASVRVARLFSIYQPPRSFQGWFIPDRLRPISDLPICRGNFRKGCGEITPEVRADVAGVAKDRGQPFQAACDCLWMYCNNDIPNMQ